MSAASLAVKYPAVPTFSDMLSISDLKSVKEEESRSELLGILLNYLGYEYGPQFVRDLWKRSKCKWEEFVVEDSADQFVDSNKLEWVENSNETLTPPAKQISNDRLKRGVRQLIRRENHTDNEVIEYVQVYMPNVNTKQNIRTITKILVQAALDKIKGEFVLKQQYLDRSIEILKIFIGSEDKQDLQLESIFAIQLLSNELEHPSGFLRQMFAKLYDDDVCSARIFRQWKNSDEEQLGKGVAVKNLVSFFNFLHEDCDEDDVEESTK